MVYCFANANLIENISVTIKIFTLFSIELSIDRLHAHFLVKNIRIYIEVGCHMDPWCEDSNTDSDKRLPGNYFQDSFCKLPQTVDCDTHVVQESTPRCSATFHNEIYLNKLGSIVLMLLLCL